MFLSNSEIERLERHRQHFPALHTKAYFNFGGQGPMPEGAIAAIATAHEQLQHLGPFSWEANVFTLKETEKTRQVMAQELQVAPKTITLTQNVLSGCNIPLWGMSWQSGDHILLSDCEYPAVIATVQELQRRFGINYSFCPLMATLNEGDPLTVMVEHLRPQTRLVIVSHILWNTGKVLPLKAMIQACHNVNVRVLVDAAQSVGVLPLNLADLGADFYAFTGHKWWCGPAGLGGLYIHPDAYDSIRPTFIGWRGVIKDEHGRPVGFHDDGQRFEVSTYDVTSLIALREAIALHHQWGTAEARYQRIKLLSQYLLDHLRTIPTLHCFCQSAPDSGLVFFRIAESIARVQGEAIGKLHTALVRALEKQGFLLRTILDPNGVRACVNYLTLEKEVDALVEAIKTTLPLVLT